MAPANGHSRGVRRVRAVIVAAAVVFVVIVVAVFAYLALNPVALERAVQARVLPKVSAALGRPVNVQRVSVRLFPRPGAVLAGVRVGGLPGEPDIVDAGEVALEPRLWPLITSRGRDVEIDRVEIDRPTLTLVRHADGTWNWQSIQQHLAARPPAPKREVVVSVARIENGAVDVVEQSPQGTRTMSVGQIDLTLTGLGPGLPLDAKLSAALASKTPNVTLAAKIDPLPASFRDLPRDELPTVTGTLSISPLELPAFEAFLSPRAASLVSGGTLKLDGRIATQSPGVYRVEANGRLDSLLLRGAPASGSFELVSQVDGERPMQATADVTRLQLTGPGVDVAGRLTASLEPLRVRYELGGKALNLDTLLALRPAPGARPTQAHRSTVLENADVQGTLRFDDVRAKELELTNLDATSRLDDGVFTLTRARANAYGGAISLDGTRVDLTRPSPAWRLVANVSGLDLATAMRSFTNASPLTGRLQTKVDLSGDGEDWAHVRETATGDGALQLAAASLTTLDLARELAPPLEEALATLGKQGAANALESMPGGTPLKNLGGSFAVKDGWIAFTKPFSFSTPLGEVELSGKVGLDERLDFTGAVRLDGARANALTGGLWSAKEPLPIPIRLGGTLASPSMSLANPQALVKQLALGAVSKRLGLDQGSLQKQLEDEAAKRLRQLGL